MRRWWLFVGVLTMAGSAWAEPPMSPLEKYQAAPWKGEIVVLSSAGDDTFYVWVEEGAINGATGERLSWDKTQFVARKYAMLCASTAWGVGEYWRGFWAYKNKDQGYVPLRSKSFLIVSIAATGPMPTAGRPSWRATQQDRVVLTVDDSRTLVSQGAVDVPTPKVMVNGYGSPTERVCWQMKAMLGWRVLYRQDELKQLWGRSELYADRPTSNTFLTPFDNQGREFEFREITGVTVHLLGRELELQRGPTLAQRIGGS